MTANTYVNQIVRKIKCGHRERMEMKKQLSSDIAAALEQGEGLEQIILRMGDAKAVAEEINFNLPAQSVKRYEKNRNRKIALVVLAALLLTMGCLVWWYIPKMALLDTDGPFDEAIVEAQAKQVITYFNEEDYEALQKMSNAQMKAYTTAEVLDEARRQVSTDWGAFKDYSGIQMISVKQQGVLLVMAAVNVQYEHTAVSFTISFDEDMKLAGLYMR